MSLKPQMFTKFFVFGTYFIETCQIGVFKCIPFYIQPRNHICNDLCLKANFIISQNTIYIYFFYLLTLQQSTLSGTFSFLTKAVASYMCGPKIRTSCQLFIKFAPLIPLSFAKEELEVIRNDFQSLYAPWERGQGGKDV